MADRIVLQPIHFGQFRFESRLVAMGSLCHEDGVQILLQLEMAVPDGIVCIYGYFGCRFPGKNEFMGHGRLGSSKRKWQRITNWWSRKEGLQKTEGLSFSQYFDIRQVEFT